MNNKITLEYGANNAILLKKFAVLVVVLFSIFTALIPQDRIASIRDIFGQLIAHTPLLIFAIYLFFSAKREEENDIPFGGFLRIGAVVFGFLFIIPTIIGMSITFKFDFLRVSIVLTNIYLLVLGVRELLLGGLYNKQFDEN